MRSLAQCAAFWLLAAGCAGVPVYELPEERVEGRPLAHAAHPRSGELTWRLTALDAKADDGLRLEFVLMNGTARDYLGVMLRLVLRGPGREMATVRYPVGPLDARSSRRVHAHLASPGFEVQEAQIELIWAQE